MQAPVMKLLDIAVNIQHVDHEDEDHSNQFMQSEKDDIGLAMS